MTIDVSLLLQQAAASGDAEAMLHAGAAALQAGIHAEAVVPVETALRAHPDEAQLWHLLGLLHRNLEDHASAADAFAEAARIAPDDAPIAHGRACVAFEAGLPAANLFDRAIFLAPADRAIRLRHAAAQIAEGRSEAAIAAIRQLLIEHPAWAEGNVALARLLWARGDRETFAASFEPAVAAMPRDIPLWRAFAETLLHDGLHDRALAVVARARAAAGPHPGFDAAEAIARSELGDLEKAGALFQSLARFSDATIIVHHLRYLYRAGRPDDAVRLAETYASRDPSHRIWPYLSIGWRLIGDPRWQWLEGDPAFVGVYDIADKLPPLDALADRLRALHTSVAQPLDQSVRGGTQTENQLFSRVEPEIRALRRALVEAVEHHVESLPPPLPGHPLLAPRRTPIAFSGSWSVRLAAGGRHVDHVHPSGWLSSALYVALPGEAERGTGEAGWLTLGQASDLGVDLPPIRTIEPKPGRLVLFPSTMWHGTRPFAAGERLSVAFDVKLQA